LSLPVFSDSWYHLSVIRAFFERGLSLHAWWEYAPFGRPHLYPPLFHLAGVAVFRLTGCNLLDVARVYDVVTFPLLLAAGWWAARCLFGTRAAFLTLLLLSLNIGLVFPCSLIIMPGTYGLVLWPFVFVLLLRNKWPMAGLLLGGMCWLHFGIGSVALVSLFIFALFKREFFRPVLWVGVMACAIFSPWLIHLCRNHEFLRSGVARLPVFIPAFTLIAASMGISRKPDKESLAILSMILASGLFLFTLQERFWTYGGFLFAILGGYGIERHMGVRARWAIAVLVVSGVSVTPFLRPLHMKLAIPVPFQSTPFLIASPFLTFVQWPQAEALPADLGALAHWITQNVSRDDVLLTDDRLLGSSLFALTGRKTTCGLWSEIMTDGLKEKLAQYYGTAGGTIIINRDETDAADLQGKPAFVAAFGKYAVLQRAP
jgi:hypothetical protein